MSPWNERDRPEDGLPKLPRPPESTASVAHTADADVRRLGATRSFTDELVRLSALAPPPCAERLYALAQCGRRAA